MAVKMDDSLGGAPMQVVIIILYKIHPYQFKTVDTEKWRGARENFQPLN